MTIPVQSRLRSLPLLDAGDLEIVSSHLTVLPNPFPKFIQQKRDRDEDDREETQHRGSPPYTEVTIPVIRN